MISFFHPLHFWRPSIETVVFLVPPPPPYPLIFFFHRMDSQSSDLSALPLNLAPASSAWAGGHSGILLATLLLTNANVMFAFSTTSWQSVFSPLNLRSAHLFMPLMMDHHLAWFSLYSCVLFLPSLGLQTCPQGVIPYFFCWTIFFFFPIYHVLFELPSFFSESWPPSPLWCALNI